MNGSKPSAGSKPLCTIFNFLGVEQVFFTGASIIVKRWLKMLRQFHNIYSNTGYNDRALPKSHQILLFLFNSSFNFSHNHNSNY